MVVSGIVVMLASVTHITRYPIQTMQENIIMSNIIKSNPVRKTSLFRVKLLQLVLLSFPLCSQWGERFGFAL